MRVYTACLALLAWAALALQFDLSIATSLARGLSLADGVIRYLGFFTILSNLLVALALSLPLAGANSAATRFFSRPWVLGGITVSIVVTGIAYNLLLRRLWHPQGLQLFADLLLHDAIPLLFAFYWWRWVPRGDYRRRELALWTIYPAVYFVYVLLHGAASGYYPYPFINVAHLGYARVLVNAVALLIGYGAVALLLLALDRAKTRAG